MNGLPPSINASVSGRIARISFNFNKPEDSTTVKIELNEVDRYKARLVEAVEPTSFNIAHVATFVNCAEVLDEACGVFMSYILIGSRRCSGHKSSKSGLRAYLYSIDGIGAVSRIMTFRLGSEVSASLDDVKFYILPGPKICFVSSANIIYVVLTDGSVTQYESSYSYSKMLTCWSDGDWLLVVGQVDTSVHMLAIHLAQSLLLNCCGNLLPVFYSEILTTIHISSLALQQCENKQSCALVNCSVYATTSYGQLIECVDGQLMNCVDLPFDNAIDLSTVDCSNGTNIIVLSQSKVVAVVNKRQFQVVWTLAGVERVLTGDFIGCGTTQAFFLPVSASSTTSCESPDMLSLIDIEMEAQNEKKSYGSKFFVTDFLQNQINQWSPADQASSDQYQAVPNESMLNAVVALQCRQSAGSVQLSAAKQELRMKQLLIADALTHLTNWSATNLQPVDAVTIPVVNIVGESISPVLNETDVTTQSSSQLLAVSKVWQKVMDDVWIIGAVVHNNSNSVVNRIELIPVNVADSAALGQTSSLKFHSSCFSHSLRTLPAVTSDQVTGKMLPDNMCYLSRHRIRESCSVLPGHTSHILLTTSLQAASPDVGFCTVAVQLILTWYVDSTLEPRSLTCGIVSLEPNVLLTNDLQLQFHPDSLRDDDQQIEFLLSLRAVQITKQVVIHSTLSKLRNVDKLVASMFSSLVQQHRFQFLTESVGCSVCNNPASSLYRTVVEVRSAKEFNRVKLQLSARNDSQMTLLIRALYSCLPTDIAIVPCDGKRLVKAAAQVLRSLHRELAPAPFDSSARSRESSATSFSSDRQSISQLMIDADRDMLNLLQLVT